MPVVKDAKQGLEVIGRITKQILHVRFVNLVNNE